MNTMFMRVLSLLPMVAGFSGFASAEVGWWMKGDGQSDVTISGQIGVQTSYVTNDLFEASDGAVLQGYVAATHVSGFGLELWGSTGFTGNQDSGADEVDFTGFYTNHWGTVRVSLYDVDGSEDIMSYKLIYPYDQHVTFEAEYLDPTEGSDSGWMGKVTWANRGLGFAGIYTDGLYGNSALLAGEIRYDHEINPNWGAFVQVRAPLWEEDDDGQDTSLVVGGSYRF